MLFHRRFVLKVIFPGRIPQHKASYHRPASVVPTSPCESGLLRQVAQHTATRRAPTRVLSLVLICYLSLLTTDAETPRTFHELNKSFMLHSSAIFLSLVFSSLFPNPVVINGGKWRNRERSSRPWFIWILGDVCIRRSWLNLQAMLWSLVRTLFYLCKLLLCL